VHSHVYYQAAVELAFAVAAIDAHTSTDELDAIERYRGVLLTAMDDAGVRRPGHPPPPPPLLAQPAVIEPKRPCASSDGPARKYRELVGPAAEPLPNAIAQRPSITTGEPFA
jgi:hypothetical protein